jgi:hypothetical protein
MRKALPCKNCGTAKLSKGEDYIVGGVPSSLQKKGGLLTYRCFHCKVTIDPPLTRPAFNALPDLDIGTNATS